MAEQAKIHGLPELKRALQQLPRQMRVKELQKSLRPSAKIIQRAAIANAPVGESVSRKMRGKAFDHYGGNLRRSIAIRREKKQFRRNQAELRIGVLSSSKGGKDGRDNGAWYWRFVEFGTSKQPAQPFLVPAFESNKTAAAQLIKLELRKGIERQARRLARRR